MNQCGLCEADLEHGYLCPGCTLATLERLDRMPRLYEALAAFLHPGGRRPETGHVRRAEPPLGLNERVFNLRGPGGIVGVLEDWRSAMQADRGWKEPPAAGLMEGRIKRAARGLALNLEWIASSWPQAGAFALEVRDLERDVASVVNPREAAERPVRLGPCPAELAPGARCGAILAYRRGESAVTCRWCGSEYPASAEAWAVLKLGMDQAAPEAELTSPQA
ncbi:hypothetical protein [Streptomyces sp. DW26H14]|uniref:hypothetical protein n=1 Tax=Streptomyces sp. DW26H14 TaxID=3435395 RepID=UPI00403DDE75